VQGDDGGPALSHNVDLIVALAAVALGAAMLALIPVEVPGESMAAIGDMASPAFFPIVSAGAIVVLGALLGVKALLQPAAGRHAWEAPERPAALAAVAALFCLYAAGIHHLGMISASVVLLLAMPWLFGLRNRIVILVVAMLTPLTVYLLFERALLVLLPHGRIF
jgi:hypothetical protein